MIFILENDVNVPSKSNKQKNFGKESFFVGVLKVKDENSTIRIRDPRDHNTAYNYLKMWNMHIMAWNYLILAWRIQFQIRIRPKVSDPIPETQHC